MLRIPSAAYTFPTNVFDVAENRSGSSSWNTERRAPVGFDRSTMPAILAFILATRRLASGAWPVTRPSWRICRYASGNDRAPSWWTTTMSSFRSALERPFGS